MTLLFGLFCAVVAAAAPANYTLFGDASLVSPGNNSQTAARLNSGTTGAGYGGVDLSIPAGLTFADFDKLSTDYKITAGDCGIGSPRFQINVIVDPTTNTTKNIFVYIGPYPNYTNCTLNAWINSGDLLETGNYVDTSQLSGGTFYQTYDSAHAAFGGYEVTGIQLVVDAGYAFTSGQTVLVDNIMVNNTLTTFESANSCKNGGYLTYTSAPGPFTNQGQCVSYYAKGGQ